MTPNIESAYDCVELCHAAGSATCSFAVWDAIYSYCHFKAGGSNNWYMSSQFDTITLLSQGPQPVPGLSACPSTPSFYEDASGAIFEICPNSDYHSTSLEVTWNLPDEISCVQQCANNTACEFGVWDKNYKVCHHKAAGGPWVDVSTQFDTIRLIAPPAAQPIPSGLTTCPGTVTQYILDDGSIYEICPDTDYHSDSYTVTPNVYSDWDCLHLCNQDLGCTLTVFDQEYNYCHFKSSANVDWVTNSGQFNTARLVQRGTRTQLSTYRGLGRWGAPVTVPANPVGAYIVPNTDFVLGFSSYGDDNFYGADGITQFSHYDWVRVS